MTLRCPGAPDVLGSDAIDATGLGPPSWVGPIGDRTGPTGGFIARISRGRSGSWGFVDVRTTGLTCRFCSPGFVGVRVGILHTAEVGSSSLPSPTR